MDILDFFPIWAVYIGTVLLLLVCVEIGFRIGVWLQDRRPDEGDPRLTGVVLGSMLGLMAFLLAFTFGIVANQDGGRKEMVVTEANAIGTAWLRAGFLGEPHGSAARGLLQEYTEIRLAAAADVTLVTDVLARSEEIHNELWAIMEETVGQGNESPIMALLVASINDVIDVHALRVRAVDLRLPRLIGIALFAATMLSFLLLGIASSADRKRSTMAMVLFTMAFVAVLTIIIDLDRPQEGLLDVSQRAMEDLLRQMTQSGQ